MFNKLYSEVLPNKLVDELQAEGFLEREKMAFFPKENGIEIKFMGIKEVKTDIYDEVTEEQPVTKEVPLLDANDEEQYVDGELLTETVDVLDESGNPETETVVVSKTFVETVVTYEKRFKETQSKPFTEYEQQEQPVMETVPKLDANGEEQYIDGELVTEEVQKTKEEQVFNEVTQEYETVEVPVTEMVEVPVEVMKDVEVIVWNDYTTEFETLLADIDTLVANHEKVDLAKLKEEQVAKLKEDTYAYITNGFDTDVKYGEVRHYSLSEIDQMNINSMMGQLQSGKIQKALWSDDSQTSHDIWTLAEFEEFYIQANTFILQARLKSDIIEGKILRAYTEDGIKSHDFTDSLTNEELTEMQGLVNEMLGTTV